MNQLGGVIELESEEEVYTSFRVTLPIYSHLQMAFERRALKVNQEYYDKHTNEVKELIETGLNNQINEQFTTKQVKCERRDLPPNEEAIETDRQFFFDESFESGE